MDADKLRMRSSLEDKLKKRREEKLRAKQRDLQERVEDDTREFAEKQRNAKDRAVADEVKTAAVAPSGGLCNTTYFMTDTVWHAELFV